MFYPDRKLAGLLALIGGLECILGISIAEDLYPSYSVSANYISDLGATCARTSYSFVQPCTIFQPSSIIFTFSVGLLGLLTVATGYLLYRFTKRQILTIFVLLTGIGALGVAIFPETTGIMHTIVSLVTFLPAGLSAIFSSRILESPVNYLAILLGALTLLALVFVFAENYAGLGPGGMERLVAYPALLWLVTFGAYLVKS